jgi:hypothetical protein
MNVPPPSKAQGVHPTPMILGSALAATGMDPTAIMMASESILSTGMAEPAATVASAPSLVASGVIVPDERGGQDRGTISQRGPSPLDSTPERLEPLEDPRRQHGEAPPRSESLDPWGTAWAEEDGPSTHWSCPPAQTVHELPSSSSS